MTMDVLRAADGRELRYYRSTPKRPPPPGWVLMHNHIAHGTATEIGTRGFRAWLSKEPPERFALCKCGWAPQAGPHYAAKDHAALFAKKPAPEHHPLDVERAPRRRTRS